MSADVWTGHLMLAGPRKGFGRLTDKWGWTVTLTAEKCVVDGQPAVRLVGTIGKPPEALRIPLLDDAAPEVG